MSNVRNWSKVAAIVAPVPVVDVVVPLDGFTPEMLILNSHIQATIGGLLISDQVWR